MSDSSRACPIDKARGGGRLDRQLLPPEILAVRKSRVRPDRDPVPKREG